MHGVSGCGSMGENEERRLQRSNAHPPFAQRPSNVNHPLEALAEVESDSLICFPQWAPLLPRVQADLLRLL